MHTIEYRVRPVTRYIVTRFEDKDGCTGASTCHGEWDNENIAHEVGYALAKAEHDRLGWSPFDERMKYPSHEQSGVEIGGGKVDRFPLRA